jgi:hypothetical protein
MRRTSLACRAAYVTSILLTLADCRGHATGLPMVERLTRSVQLSVEIDRICAMTSPCAQLREGSLKLFNYLFFLGFEIVLYVYIF